MIFQPILPADLKSRLSSGGVFKFAFKKTDGTLRTATGTTDLSLIPTVDHPKGRAESSPKVVPFYDLEKGAWRCLSVRTEIYLS